MRKRADLLVAGAVLAGVAWAARAQENDAARRTLIARAKALELNTPYVPPPGEPIDHHAAGYAKIMCSAVFITGLDPGFAAENVGGFTAPFDQRPKLGKPLIDRVKKTVTVPVPGRASRMAMYTGDQGCVALPIGQTSLSFRPVRVRSKLPDAATQPWPMGDAPEKEPLPPHGIDLAKVKRAVDAAFDPPAGGFCRASAEPDDCRETRFLPNARVLPISAAQQSTTAATAALSSFCR